MDLQLDPPETRTPEELKLHEEYEAQMEICSRFATNKRVLHASRDFMARHGINEGFAEAPHAAPFLFFDDTPKNVITAHYAVHVRCSVKETPFGNPDSIQPEPQDSTWRLKTHSGKEALSELYAKIGSEIELVKVVFTKPFETQHRAMIELGDTMEVRDDQRHGNTQTMLSSFGMPIKVKYHGKAQYFNKTYMLTCAHCLVFKPTIVANRQHPAESGTVVYDDPPASRGGQLKLSLGEIYASPRFEHLVGATSLFDYACFSLGDHITTHSLHWADIRTKLLKTPGIEQQDKDELMKIQKVATVADVLPPPKRLLFKIGRTTGISLFRYIGFKNGLGHCKSIVRYNNPFHTATEKAALPSRTHACHVGDSGSPVWHVNGIRQTISWVGIVRGGIAQDSEFIPAIAPSAIRAESWRNWFVHDVVAGAFKAPGGTLTPAGLTITVQPAELIHM
ncbi:hypothetical protein T439DRAFT_354888 [Meredithblackwellia eburnea MCA 4105]